MLKKSLWIIIFSCILHTNFIYSMGMVRDGCTNSIKKLTRPLDIIELQNDPLYKEVIACQSQEEKDAILVRIVRPDNGPNGLFRIAAAILGGANPSMQYQDFGSEPTLLYQHIHDKFFVQFLLEHRANPNLGSRYYTPLSVAPTYAVAELLIKHGAQISDKEKNDEEKNLINSALSYAENLQDAIKLIQLYIQHGVNSPSSLLNLYSSTIQRLCIPSLLKDEPQSLEQIHGLIQLLIKGGANLHLTFQCPEKTPVEVAQERAAGLEKHMLELRQNGKSNSADYMQSYKKAAVFRLFSITASNPSLSAQEAIAQACPAPTNE